jgi:hypothetical protein
MGFCMMPVQTAAYNTIPQQDMARATSLVNVMIRLFASMTTAALTTFLIFALGQHGAAGASITGGTAPISALTAAFDDAFILMSGVTIIGMFLALFLRDPVVEAARKAGGIEVVRTGGRQAQPTPAE